MSTEVKVNLSLMDQAISTYSVQIELLEAAYSEAVKAIEILRNSAWKSSGADAFFQNYDETWAKDFRDHIDYLKHLYDCLKLAREGFYEEYNKKLY